MTHHLDLSDRSAVERSIAGALRNCIQAHGPIALEGIGSATSRVFGGLKSLRRSNARYEELLELERLWRGWRRIGPRKEDWCHNSYPRR